MSEAQQAGAVPQTTEQTWEQVSLLDQIVEQGRLARDPAFFHDLIEQAGFYGFIGAGLCRRGSLWVTHWIPP